MNLFTFIITSPETGRMLDMGTYPNQQCTEDTANDSPAAAPGVRLTIINHDEDGNHTIISEEVLKP